MSEKNPELNKLLKETRNIVEDVRRRTYELRKAAAELKEKTLPTNPETPEQGEANEP